MDSILDWQNKLIIKIINEKAFTVYFENHKSPEARLVKPGRGIIRQEARRELEFLGYSTAEAKTIAQSTEKIARAIYDKMVREGD